MIYINGKETKQNIEILHDLFDEIYELDKRISKLEDAHYIRDFLDPYPGDETLDTSKGYGTLLAIHSDLIIDEIPRQVLDEMYPDDLEIDFDKYYKHSMTAGIIVRTNEIPSYIVHDYVNKFRSNLATNMRIL